MSTYIQKILTKKMTRKEFLTYLGMLMLAIFGISSLLKNISNLNPTKNPKQSKSLLSKTKTSFGSDAYGV